MIKKTHSKLLFYEVLSALVMVLPLIILFIINKDHYLKSVTPLGLSLSGILLLIFAFIMVKDKFNLSSNKTYKFFIFFLFCYVFEPFLIDLKMISFMAFLGMGLSQILFDGKIKQLKNTLKGDGSEQNII